MFTVNREKCETCLIYIWKMKASNIFIKNIEKCILELACKRALFIKLNIKFA